MPQTSRSDDKHQISLVLLPNDTIRVYEQLASIEDTSPIIIIRYLLSHPQTIFSIPHMISEFVSDIHHFCAKCIILETNKLLYNIPAVVVNRKTCSTQHILYLEISL